MLNGIVKIRKMIANQIYKAVTDISMVTDIQNPKTMVSNEVADTIMKIYKQDNSKIALKEYFYVLFYDNALNLRGYEKISEGGITSTVIDIRLIFASALNQLATRIIIAHNHPTGVLKASEQDIKLTNRVKEAGKIMDIELVDHIIVVPNGEHFSFANKHLI